jgi:trans-L-3-hydroxyproline dehydratase
MNGLSDWEPPADWRTIRTIETHAGGEPLRIVVDGWPAIGGDTVLEKRRYVEDHHDHLRTALMWEPRGHADMYGAIPVEPETDESDLGVLFTHNEGYSTMCGHGVIALATVAIEADMVESDPGRPAVRMDTPAGPVTARAAVEDDRVARVRFENVPSFVYARDRSVDVPEVGEITYDVAFGGAFYVYCDAADAGVDLTTDHVDDLIRVGTAIKRAVSEDLAVDHPGSPDLGYLYGTIFTGPPRGRAADVRNVCVFADGEVDRSPTGTGVSGHLARETARGGLGVGEPFVVESIVGSTFTGRVRDRRDYEGYDVVVPEVEGSAHVIGSSQFVVDPEDRFADGFFLR